MKVHVVASYPKADQILARKARYLTANGWTLSDEPDPTADFNLFFPYIEYTQRFPEYSLTPTGAYFTHHDTSRPEKDRWWNYAKEHVDVRWSTSYVEELKESGLTFHARPPVDWQFHKCGIEPTVNQVFKLGVSGMSYKDDRKGEDLIGQLMKVQQKYNFRIVGAGRNWPFEHQWYEWERMPEFYTGLSAYLCTSRVEGVPMPPLEALACGVPVIIPEGVGMLDELPEIPGIWRYKAGSYRSLLYALKKIEDRVYVPALREAVSEYTIENWCADFIKGVNDYFTRPKFKAVDAGGGTREMVYAGGKVVGSEGRYINLSDKKEYAYEAEPVELKPKLKSRAWMTKAGMYCVAFGEPSRKCAVTAIKSFKQQMPEIPVALVSTAPLGVEDMFIHKEDLDIGGRLGKLAVYDLAPEDWEYILYLDADTETAQDVSFIYELLVDGWEAVICKDMVKYHTARMMIRPDNKEEYDTTMSVLGCEEVFQYNGGVFAFRRCENTETLFKNWNKEWQRWGARDQGALLRALYSNPIKLHLLTNVWNASDRYPLPCCEPAIIHHNMQARRWGGLIYGRTDDEQAWMKVKEWESRNRG